MIKDYLANFLNILFITFNLSFEVKRSKALLLLVTDFYKLVLADDTYLTIETASEGIFKDKGSKFIAFAYPVSSENDLKVRLDILKKEHHSARHHCWAYRIGKDGEIWRANDDGEPSNSAGKPILGQIQSKGLSNVGVIVVRYFGGTLLGVSGLMHAYKEATADALVNAKIIEVQIELEYRVSFPFEMMNDVMKFLKDNTAKIIAQTYDTACCIDFKIRKTKEKLVLESLNKIEGVNIILNS